MRSINKTPKQPDVVTVQELRPGEPFILAEAAHCKHPSIFVAAEVYAGPAGPLEDGDEYWCVKLDEPGRLFSKPLSTPVRRIELLDVHFAIRE